jgi:hypothetical protein
MKGLRPTQALSKKSLSKEKKNKAKRKAKLNDVGYDKLGCSIFLE